MRGILLDLNSGDIIVNNRQIIIDDITEQSAQIIICSGKGEFKEHPLLGVGLIKFLHSVGKEREIIREIKLQLSLDGIKVKKLSLDDNKLRIEV